MAIAIVSTLHDGNEVQLRRAFGAAKMSSPVEATLVPETNPAARGSYYISVTADTSEQAKAELATLTKALAAAFPSAERNLSVSPNGSTLPAPNDLTRRISFGVVAVIILMMLGCQLLLVIGARLEGVGRAGLLAALATPFTILIFPTSGGSRAHSYMYNSTATADWKFVLLLLALTPVALILGLWITRGSRPLAGQTPRAVRAPRS